MKKPLVSVVMGSDSDLSQMKHCAEMLEYFGIPFEITFTSAHRTPEKAASYAKNLSKRGIQIVIAGAGGAAHLAGVIASLTVLPVIGVPMKTKSLSGVDSLYSIVQMPKGIPVATVTIGEAGAANAAILAAEILGLKNINIKKKLMLYKKKLTNGVSRKALKLKKVGYKHYQV
ncbi:MAG: 5-(carboxyamino)imidazole ribonucleotide mutase [Elusimicrobia bacterium]|nr:5-(carboxyamino)imidazole ribonucleotide mutase [Elusimicrobiota bacterium]